MVFKSFVKDVFRGWYGPMCKAFRSFYTAKHRAREVLLEEHLGEVVDGDAINKRLDEMEFPEEVTYDLLWTILERECNPKAVS